MSGLGDPTAGGVLVLSIEVSNPSVGAAVAAGWLDEDETAWMEEVVAAGTRERDDLTPAVARVLARVELGRERGGGARAEAEGDVGAEMVVRAAAAARRVGLIALSLGPGGYTSLRMGLATATMLAMAGGGGGERSGGGGVRCVGVPTSRVALWHARRGAAGGAGAGVRGPVAVALAGKAGMGFVTVFDAEDRVLAAELMDGAALERAARAMTSAGAGGGVIAEQAGTLVGDQHMPEGLRAAARGLGWAERAIELSALGLLAVVQREGLADRAAGPETLELIYGREPEAVTKWRELHGRG